MINWEYVETPDRGTPPNPVEYGTGWEYWSDRITPGEHVAVWRRDADQYGEVEAQLTSNSI